jgi:glycoprotein endo-alpha-1,2-mannosidase
LYRYGNPKYDAGRYLHWNHRRLAHWNPGKAARYPQHRHEPPDDIGSNFYPLLGAYSSRSPDIIDKHMRMIRMSGAGKTEKPIILKNQSNFFLRYSVS